LFLQWRQSLLHKIYAFVLCYFLVLLDFISLAWYIPSARTNFSYSRFIVSPRVDFINIFDGLFLLKNFDAFLVNSAQFGKF
jgi:hypothetical protein